MSEQMNPVQRIARNVAAILLSEAVGKLITFYALISLAGYLGPSGNGDYALVFAYLSFFFILATFGMDTIVVRELSRTPERSGEIIGSALLLRGVLALGACVFANLILWPVDLPGSVKALARLGSVGLLLSVASVWGAVLHWKMRLDQRSLATIASRLAGAGAILVLIALKAKLLWFVVAALVFGVPGVLVGVPEAAILFLLARRCIDVRPKPVRHICLMLIKESWPLALCASFIIIYLRIDQLMLQLMLGDESLVGNYNVATRIAEVLSIIPLGFMASVFPSICRAWVKQRDAFEKTYQRSFKYMNIIIIPVAFASLVLSRTIVVRLLNPLYSPAASVLPVLLFAEVFIFLGIVNNRLLVSSGHQRLDFIFTGSSAVVNVALNLVLIRPLGMLGAAIGSLIAYATGPVIGLFIPVTRPFSKAMFATAIRPVVASSVMLFVLWEVHDRLGLYGSVGVGTLVYLAALVLLRGFDHEDVVIAGKLVTRGARV